MSDLKQSLGVRDDGVAVSSLSFAAKTLTLPQIVVLALGVLLIARNFLPAFDNVPAPPVGFTSAFEPYFLARLRFAKAALPQINEGHRKVNTHANNLIEKTLIDCFAVQGHYIQDLQE